MSRDPSYHFTVYSCKLTRLLFGRSVTTLAINRTSSHDQPSHKVQTETACLYLRALKYRYWEESRDAGNFRSSILLDASYGFGGDGSGFSSCITTGPFANYTISLGPVYQITYHSINRRISDLSSTGAAQSQDDTRKAKTDFK